MWSEQTSFIQVPVLSAFWWHTAFDIFLFVHHDLQVYTLNLILLEIERDVMFIIMISFIYQPDAKLLMF